MHYTKKSMPIPQEQIDRRVGSDDEGCGWTEQDAMWDLLSPSNTGTMPNPQGRTGVSLQGYPEQTVWTQQGQPSETASDLLTRRAWTSAVWGIHPQHLPEAQSAFEQQPDRRSLGTGYTSNDASQVEYHANTFQTGSVATGFNPAQSMDYGSGPDYDPALSPPNESSYTRPVGAESHRIAEPSGPTRSESNEKSGKSQRKRSKNLPRFLVKRQDEEWFKHNGELVPSAEVYGMSAVASMCNVGALKVKEAVADIGPGEVASVTANRVTWDIELVVS
jgi:hypothetical protein